MANQDPSKLMYLQKFANSEAQVRSKLNPRPQSQDPYAMRGMEPSSMYENKQLNYHQSQPQFGNLMPQGEMYKYGNRELDSNMKQAERSFKAMSIEPKKEAHFDPPNNKQN